MWRPRVVRPEARPAGLLARPCAPRAPAPTRHQPPDRAAPRPPLPRMGAGRVPQLRRGEHHILRRHPHCGGCAACCVCVCVCVCVCALSAGLPGRLLILRGWACLRSWRVGLPAGCLMRHAKEPLRAPQQEPLSRPLPARPVRCPLPAGNRDQNVVKCPCCESQLTFDAPKRQVTVTELAG